MIAKNTNAFIGVAIALAAWTATGETAIGETPRATLSLNELIAGMQRIDDAFDPAKHSYFIRCRQKHELLDADEATLQMDPWVEVAYARKGAWLYCSVTRPMAGQPKPINETIVWRDDGVSVRKMLNSIDILPQLLPQAYEFFRYTDNIFADAYRLLPARKTTHLLPELADLRPSEVYFLKLPGMIIANKSQYAVRKELEKAGDAWCHVIDWEGHDSIWIDHSHGFVTRCRELKLKADLLIAAYTNDDLFEARRGLWLPRKGEEWWYHRPNAPPQLLGTVRRKDYISLDEIRFDAVDGSLFHPLREKERLLVNDSVRGIQYWKYPPDADPIQQVLQDAKREAHRGDAPPAILVQAGVGGLVGMALLIAALRPRSG